MVDGKSLLSIYICQEKSDYIWNKNVFRLCLLFSQALERPVKRKKAIVVWSFEGPGTARKYLSIEGELCATVYKTLRSCVVCLHNALSLGSPGSHLSDERIPNMVSPRPTKQNIGLANDNAVTQDGGKKI